MQYSTQYFRNPAAEITHWPAGYIRADWHSMAADPIELRAIYGHVLRAMQRYGVTAVLFVHQQPEAIPEDLQQWLLAEWIPRAMREANYRRCALVEVYQPTTETDARAISQHLVGKMEFSFFTDVAAAAAWLLRPAE
jgi:hypothetical protein